MGPGTDATSDTADRETDEGVPLFEFSGIIPMDSQTAAMTAGTGKPVELERGNQVIIKGLGYRIAKIGRKGYHKHASRQPKCESAQGA